jgi:mannose-1-phosphate guanylyltransferase
MKVKKAVILAGGFGTRLRGIHDKPKCLIDIGGGETLLGHQIGLLRKHGIEDIKLSLHYMADEVKAYARKFGDGISFIYEPEPLGTGGAMKLATRGLREPVIICNGDIITHVDFSALAEKALAARTHTLSVATAPAKDFGGLELLGDKIIAFKEKSGGDELARVSEGFYVLFPGIFDNLPDKFSVERDCFPALARRGVLRAYFNPKRWLDVGTPERFQERMAVLGHNL